MSKIPLQTGKPTEPGLYVVMSTWEAAPEIKAFLTIEWNGKCFCYRSHTGQEIPYPRPIHGWVGPIAEDLELEYDL